MKGSGAEQQTQNSAPGVLQLRIQPTMGHRYLERKNYTYTKHEKASFPYLYSLYSTRSIYIEFVCMGMLTHLEMISRLCGGTQAW